MKILLGIGNRLRSDDGAGSYFAENFKGDGWLAIDAGSVPENYLAVVARNRPQCVVIVDAADMGLEPGMFRRITLEKISSEYSFNTHKPPSSFIVDRLKKTAHMIVFIGIQPGKIEFGEELSAKVTAGLRELELIILNDRIETIPEQT